MDENIEQINELLKKIEKDEKVKVPFNIEVHIASLGLEGKSKEYLVIEDSNKYLHGTVNKLEVISEDEGKEILEKHGGCNELCYKHNIKTNIGWGN